MSTPAYALSVEYGWLTLLTYLLTVTQLAVSSSDSVSLHPELEELMTRDKWSYTMNGFDWSTRKIFHQRCQLTTYNEHTNTPCQQYTNTHDCLPATHIHIVSWCFTALSAQIGHGCMKYITQVWGQHKHIRTIKQWNNTLNQ